MIRLAVRVAREQAELVLAELAQLAPGGLEERDIDEATVEFAIYGAPLSVADNARCLVLGAIRQSANANEFLQIPGFVVLLNEAYHNYRVIPIDGRPDMPDTIKLWGGDSRGRWEGSTLVVEVKNLNGKNRLSHDGDFLSDTARIVERYTFTDADHMTYEATIDDPRVFTRPWKIAIPNVRAKQRSTDETWESACHEGERSAGIMLQESK